MKILISCRRLDRMAGGVERMAIWLANEMNRRGHTVSLLTWDCLSGEPFYEINSSVDWIKVNIGQTETPSTWSIRFARLKKIRRLLRQERFDIVVAFQHGVFWNFLIAGFGMKQCLIAAERNSLDRFNHTRHSGSRSVVFFSFLLAKKITVQQASFVEQYPDFLRARMHVIENPVFPAPASHNRCSASSGRFRLLSVGRLSYQKNPICLLKAFEKISRKFPEWDLIFVGSGELRKELESYASTAGLTPRVLFQGLVEDVDAQYDRAHLFCLASRWEGFPNALGEAMSHGIPCIGFAECSGVKELISTNKTGWLAKGNGDSESLAECFDTAMRGAEERKRIGEAAKNSVAKFSPDAIGLRWESLFEVASTR